MRALASALLAMFLAGCVLSRSPIVDRDAPERPDVPGLDAPMPDVPGLDAPMPDVLGLDAPMPDVSGLDAPEPIDTPLDSPPACVRTAEVCDRVDNDCNDVIDDDGACGCDAVTVDGRAYLSCPSATGDQAWRNSCGSQAEGYRLATFSSATEQDRVVAALRTAGVSASHWVGLNDFDVSGTYVWFDRTPMGFAPVGSNPALRFVALRVDTNTYEELAGTDARRVLCEAQAPPGACATSEAPACNGIDEDCDGRADQAGGCNVGCITFTFWDSVYYLCDSHVYDDAAMLCGTEMGARLVLLNDGTEHAAVDVSTAPEVWIGLRQAPSSMTPAMGWTWRGDPGLSYALPPTVPPWDTGGGGQPNDDGPPEDNQENCGSLRGDGDLEDDPCTTSHEFLCERAWSY